MFIREQLYNDLTKRENSPPVSKQINFAISNIQKEYTQDQQKLTEIEKHLKTSSHVIQTFPSNFLEKFREACREENDKKATKVLDSALNSSNEAFQYFGEEINNGLIKAREFYREFSEKVDIQIREPGTNWRKNYLDYSKPGEKPEKDKKIAEKYVIYRGTGTVGGLLKVLEGVESQLESFLSLRDRFNQQRGKLEKFDINDRLGQRLTDYLDINIPKRISREKYYELSPPKPLFSDPGISVYHEVEIENIEFERLDPAGILSKGKVPSPTPIYLWFIGTTLWWTSWEITINLEKPITEEIYDYKNKTIPRPASIYRFEKFPNYILKPLPYKQKFDKKSYNFHLATISLKYHTIDSPN